MSDETEALPETEGRVRIMEIDLELLASWFKQDAYKWKVTNGLPPDATIIGIKDDMNYFYARCLLKIASKEFTPVAPGKEIPRVVVTFKMVD